MLIKVLHPPADPLLNVDLTKRFSVIGEKVRLSSLEQESSLQIFIKSRQSRVTRSYLDDDDIKQISPARPDHEGHPLVHSLEGGVGDHKQLLSGLY